MNRLMNHFSHAPAAIDGDPGSSAPEPADAASPLTDGAPRVLCVDDEPSVLAALARTLRHHVALDTATSGAEALELLAERDYAVVVSDMMMPGMNGAEFLHEARALRPESVRVLLTGHADAHLAAAAVNDGAISHYLTKPCPSAQLVSVLREAAQQHERALVERDVLERTLTASLHALTQTLSLAAPGVFARTNRAQSIVDALVGAVDPADRWATQVAVPLSQLGAVSLTSDVARRWSTGATFDQLGPAVLGRLRSVATTIVASIPRLELTAEIIKEGMVDEAPPVGSHVGAVLLWVAFQLDAFESRGLDRQAAVRHVADQLFPSQRILLAPIADEDPRIIEEVSVIGLHEGMVLAQDVSTPEGVLLVGRGTCVSAALLNHLAGFLGPDQDRVFVYGGC
ncbi:MAG: response regulator [Acidimicrobiales bacterium]